MHVWLSKVGWFSLRSSWYFVSFVLHFFGHEEPKEPQRTPGNQFTIDIDNKSKINEQGDYIKGI